MLLLCKLRSGLRSGRTRKPTLQEVEGTMTTNVWFSKTSITTEVDALIFDAILLVHIVARLDDAFAANIRSADDIYRIRVIPPRRSYVFRWKEKMEDIPIFRQAVMTEDGLRTSDTMALRYHTYLYYLQRLGIGVGFMQLLTSYVIRRGAGESVEGM